MLYDQWNMKKIVIYLTATAFIALGIGTAIVFSTGDVFNKNGKNTYAIHEEKSSNIEGIKEIYVDVSSAKVKIDSESRIDAKARFYGDIVAVGIYSKPEFEMYTEGDILYIKEKSKAMNIGFFNSNLNIDIALPSSYENNLKMVSSSGDIEIKKFKLNDVYAKVSSGNLTISDMVMNNLEYNSSSGDLNGDKVSAKNTFLNSNSGNMKIKRFTGSLESSASSGDTMIEYDTFNDKIDMKTSSGNAVIKLPKDSQFTLNAKASSGEIICKFPITITGENKSNRLEGAVGNGSNKINIECASGDIRIE